MLDTSDKNTFVSSYDSAMGTSVYVVDLSDLPAIVADFDASRRQIIITNSGDEVVYLSLASLASPGLYTVKLKKDGLFVIDGFGGAITAVCDIGKSTNKVFVTDIH